MSQDEGKRRSGDKAAEYVTDGSIVGVGTGSTVAFFIAALGRMKHRIEGAVSSSERSTALLKELGIPVLDLNATGLLSLYVDGAVDCVRLRRLI
jgi:ribose 5-phosphate isomerase A